MRSIKYIASALFLLSLALLVTACLQSDDLGSRLTQTCYQSCQVRYDSCATSGGPITGCIDNFRRCQGFCD